MLNFLFYLSVVTLSLGQFTAITKSGGLNIYIFDITVALYAIYGLLFFLLSKKLLINKNLVLFFLFAVVGVFSVVKPLFILNQSQLLVSIFYLFRFIIYLIAGVVTYNLVEYKHISKKNISFSIIYSGLFIAFAGFIQLIVLPDFTVLDASFGWDPHKNRLASTFFDPNFTGGYLTLVFAFLLHLTFSSAKSLESNLQAKRKMVHNINFNFLLFSLFIILVAIFLTFSRSAWGMLAIVVFIYGVFKLRFLLVLSLFVVFMAYFAVPRVQTRISGITDPADSAYFRLVSWQNTLDIVKDNLLLGVGFNAFRYAQVDYGFFDPGTLGGNSGAGSDSSFLLVLATTGVAGFSVFLLAYIFLIFESWRTNSTYKLLLLSVFFGLFLQAQFINAFFYPQILFLLTLFLVFDS